MRLMGFRRIDFRRPMLSRGAVDVENYQRKVL
jgi:hypothetical protein